MPDSPRRGRARDAEPGWEIQRPRQDRKSTRLNSSHLVISYAVFCLKKKKPQLRTSTSQWIATFLRLALRAVSTYREPRPSSPVAHGLIPNTDRPRAPLTTMHTLTTP